MQLIRDSQNFVHRLVANGVCYLTMPPQKLKTAIVFCHVAFRNKLKVATQDVQFISPYKEFISNHDCRR